MHPSSSQSPRRQGAPAPSFGAIVLELVLATLLSRHLSRRYVRQGLEPSTAAARGVDAMMMSTATGVVVLLWLILALPTWILPLTSTFTASKVVLWCASVAADVVIFGLPLLAMMVYIRVIPELRSSWQRAVTQPIVIFGSLLSIWPAKIAVIIGVKLLAGILP